MNCVEEMGKLGNSTLIVRMWISLLELRNVIGYSNSGSMTSIINRN